MAIFVMAATVTSGCRDWSIGFGFDRADDLVDLDCAAGDIRHILRIAPRRGTAEDVSFVPPHKGSAEVSDSGYVLRFDATPKGYLLQFRINRYTGDGNRELIEPSGRTVEGHGGFDAIKCVPYTGKPL